MGFIVDFIKDLFTLVSNIAALIIICYLMIAVPVLLVRLVYRTFLIRHRYAPAVVVLDHYEERERLERKRDRANDSFDTAYGFGGSVTIHHKAYTWVRKKWAECVYKYQVGDEEYTMEICQNCQPPETLDIFYCMNKPTKNFTRESHVSGIARLVGYIVVFAIVNAFSKLVGFEPLFYIIFVPCLVYIFLFFVKPKKEA